MAEPCPAELIPAIGALNIDPLRLTEATTLGIAFLAAGLIFTTGEKVKNITTRASLWLAGATYLPASMADAAGCARDDVGVLIVGLRAS